MTLRFPPPSSPAQLLERVERRWDLSGPVPVPRWDVECPSCRGTEVALRQCSFHYRHKTGSKSPWRCDVSFKCLECSLTFTFGVPVPQGMYEAVPRTLGWREVKELLEEHASG